MKSDHLEERIRNLPERVLPQAWRGEVLRAARAAIRPSGRVTEASPAPWWRTLLWPCPAAWAGVAATWCVILALNLTARTAQGTVSKNAPPPVPVQLWMAFSDQDHLLPVSPTPRAVRRPAPPVLPQPRSCSERLTFIG